MERRSLFTAENNEILHFVVCSYHISVKGYNNALLTDHRTVFSDLLGNIYCLFYILTVAKVYINDKKLLATMW